MRTGWLAFGTLTALGSALWPSDPAEESWTIIVGGDTAGYLSPCGCTKPMSGGIRRRASAVAAIRDERTLIVENDGLIAGTDRQDELKAETLAEAFRAMEVDAINLGYAEARFGIGLVSSLVRLSGGKVVCSTLADPAKLGLAPFAAKGPFLVGGASTRSKSIAEALGARDRGVDEACKQLVAEARADGRLPVLLFEGGRAEAVALAERHPDLFLVVYRSSSTPPQEPERVGATTLATPGEKGKQFVVLRARGRSLGTYAIVRLGPEYEDDPVVSRLYRNYLARVAEEDLLARRPRAETAPYAGSKACAPCHADSYRIWKETRHAGALATLERDGHDRDPECVGCHVVGLESLAGFVSRQKTPDLSDVGCESCHGPGARHASDPERYPMGKVGEKSCLPCHEPNHSPNFDFSTYWPKIAHP